jgi:hypothetical protein
MSDGLRWGPFTLRIPLLHYRAEWPELLQGLTVGSATGLSVVPLYAEHFGMPFETAIALVVLQTLVICSSFLLFGEPFAPGWLTPALPLVLAAAVAFPTGPERTEFVNAVVLLTGLVFLLFGLTGLGKMFLRLVPRVLRATIILGAGLSAIYGEFIPRSGGRPARMDALTVSILAAAGISLLLMFSKPLEPWKARYPWLRTLASMGIAPGFFVGTLVGWTVGELRFDEFAAYSGPLVFWPDFSGLVANFSVLGRGLPSPAAFAHAVPLALVAYLVGFTDIITGTAILQDAAADRPDEPIPFDARRTHLSLGLRNAGIALIGGPFFPLQGPLWAGAMIVVSERYRRGKQEMQSIFSGVSSYYVLGIPWAYFIAPLLVLLRPTLDIAFSLTLLLTGFACAYVALAMLEDRIERGIALLAGATIMYFSLTTGLLIGIVLTLALIGPSAWRDSSQSA